MTLVTLTSRRTKDLNHQESASHIPNTSRTRLLFFSLGLLGNCILADSLRMHVRAFDPSLFFLFPREATIVASSIGIFFFSFHDLLASIRVTIEVALVGDIGAGAET